MVWLNEVKNPKPQPIYLIRPVQSGKGWILKTDNYDCFVWRTDPLINHLLEAVTKWADEGGGKAIQIKPNKAKKRGFEIDLIPAPKGSDLNHEPCDWYHLTGDEFTITEPDAFQLADINPLL